MVDTVRRIGLADTLDRHTNYARRARPDMYLSTLDSNDKLSKSLRFGLPVHIKEVRRYNPRETVPAMVRNLVDYNSTKAAWYRLANT